MLKKVTSLALLLSSVSYAGYVDSVNFIYSHNPEKQTSYLEIQLNQEGNCLVFPRKKEGKQIVVDIKGCSIKRTYSIGNRGNFVRRAKLFPQRDKIRLTVDLLKPGILNITRTNNSLKLRVIEGNYTKPNITIVKMSSGEKAIFSFPFPIGKPSFKKETEKLLIFLPGLKFFHKKEKLPSSLIKEIEFSNFREGGVISIMFAPHVKAIEVNSRNKQLSITLLERKKSPNNHQEDLKVSLNFSNADVKSVIRAIATIAGINVVFDPDVKGKVNVEFTKPIPWKKALNAILDSLSLTYLETPDYIRILPKEKLLEKQSKIVKDYIIHLNYISAADLEKAIKNIIESTNTEGSGQGQEEKVAADNQTNSLLLKVTPFHYKEIMNLVKKLDRPRKQILVKAKIVQVSSRAEKDLGFTWYINGYNGESSTHLVGSYGFNIQSYTPISNGFGNISNIPVMDSTLALGILSKSQTLRIELALKALEIEGEAQIISAPKVLTLDNEEAKIEQGIEIPYRETSVSPSGTTTYTVNFKKASLLLKVKPHITSKGDIILDLEVRKDSSNYEYTAITGNGEPAIDTRNVKSKVIVHNGDTIVIGGIYEKEKNRNSTEVPGLSRIPLLGWLFKGSQTIISKRELLIFITPVIMNSDGKK